MVRKLRLLTAAVLIMLPLLSCDDGGKPRDDEHPPAPAVYVTVSFEKNTVETVKGMPSPVKVLKGGKISKPFSEPARNNNSAVFQGWVKSDLSSLFDFSNEAVYENINLYAKWGEEVIAERNSYTLSGDSFAYWSFSAEQLEAADQLVFYTDNSKPINRHGFGAIRIGFQEATDDFGLSGGIQTSDWTPFDSRWHNTGKCIIVINLSAIEDHRACSGEYDGVTAGELRLYTAYWPFVEFGLSGYAKLIKGEADKPLYSKTLETAQGGYAGFVYYVP